MYIFNYGIRIGKEIKMSWLNGSVVVTMYIHGLPSKVFSWIPVQLPHLLKWA